MLMQDAPKRMLGVIIMYAFLHESCARIPPIPIPYPTPQYSIKSNPKSSRKEHSESIPTIPQTEMSLALTLRARPRPRTSSWTRPIGTP